MSRIVQSYIYNRFQNNNTIKIIKQYKMQDEIKQTKFHNLPQILNKVRAKLICSSKMFKMLHFNDKSRLELQHFILWIGNYFDLIEQQVKLVLSKNYQLQKRNSENQNLYHEYYQKYLNIKKERQKELMLSNSKINKLIKQNQFLTFINKGLRIEIDQKTKYIGDYKYNKSKQIKQIIQTVQDQVKTGAKNICDKINKFIDDCQTQHQQIQINNNNHQQIVIIQKSSKNNSINLNNSNHAYPNILENTQRKRSSSAVGNNNVLKKNKIHNKLSKIIQQQIKLNKKNERYLQAYLC